MRESLDTIFGFSELGILQERNIHKKNFYEHGEFNTARKSLFTDAIDKLRIVAICDKNTINIDPFVTEERMYKEIFFIQVELKDKTKQKKITEIIHHVIPNPIVIICTFEDEILLSVAPKRLNQQEKGKVVVEAEYNSIWIDTPGEAKPQEEFLKILFLKNFRFDNLHVFYSDITKAVIYSQFIELTGVYAYSKTIDLDSVAKIARNLKEVQENIAFHTNEDKRLKNFGDKVANHQKLLDAQVEWDTLKQTILNL